MKALLYLKKALNVVVLLYVGIIVAVVAAGGFSFRVAGMTIRAHSLEGPVIILLGALALRGALALPPKNLALLAISVVMTLMVLEGFLRWWYPTEAWPVLRLYYRPAPVIGYEHVPGVAGTGSFGETIVINSHGLRDVERPWKKPPGVRRALVLGDSFTFGMKVAGEASYPKALERLLNEGNSGLKWDVINAGVVAYSLCQERKWLSLKGWRYEPDLVVVGFFGDDPHCKGEASGDRFAGTDPYRNFTRVSVLYNFLRNSYAVLNARYFERIRPVWTGGLEARSHYLERNRFTDIPDEEWVGVAGDLRTMKEGAAERGARLLVVVIPDAGQVGFPKLQEPTRRLLAVCRQEGIDCLDSTPEIEKAPEPLSLYLYPLDAHLSPAGHSFLARLILERMRAEGL